MHWGETTGFHRPPSDPVRCCRTKLRARCKSTVCGILLSFKGSARAVVVSVDEFMPWATGLSQHRCVLARNHNNSSLIDQLSYSCLAAGSPTALVSPVRLAAGSIRAGSYAAAQARHRLTGPPRRGLVRTRVGTTPTRRSALPCRLARSRAG